MIYAAIIFVTLFAVADGFSDAWIFRDIQNRIKKLDNWGLAEKQLLQLMDRRLNENRNWHRWQAARQGLVIAFCAWMSQSWPLLLLGAAVFWIVHDPIVNKVGLNRSFFYVGNTAAIDMAFRKYFNRPELAMAIVKVAALLAGIYTTIRW